MDSPSTSHSRPSDSDSDRVPAPVRAKHNAYVWLICGCPNDDLHRQPGRISTNRVRFSSRPKKKKNKKKKKKLTAHANYRNFIVALAELKQILR